MEEFNFYLNVKYNWCFLKFSLLISFKGAFTCLVFRELCESFLGLVGWKVL